MISYHDFYKGYRRKNPHASPARIAKKYELAFGVIVNSPPGALVVDKFVRRLYVRILGALKGLWDSDARFRGAWGAVDVDNGGEYFAPTQIAQRITIDIAPRITEVMFRHINGPDAVRPTLPQILQTFTDAIPTEYREPADLYRVLEDTIKQSIVAWVRANRQSMPADRPAVMTTYHMTGNTMTYLMIQEIYEYLRQVVGSSYGNRWLSLLELWNHETIMGPVNTYLLQLGGTTFVIMGEEHAMHCCIARTRLAMTAYKFFVELSSAVPHIQTDIFLENAPKFTETRTPRRVMHDDIATCEFLSTDIFLNAMRATPKPPPAIFASHPLYQAIERARPTQQLETIKAFLRSLPGAGHEEFFPIYSSGGLMSAAQNYFFPLIPSRDAWKSKYLRNVRVHVADLRDTGRTEEDRQRTEEGLREFNRFFGVGASQGSTDTADFIFREPRILRDGVWIIDVDFVGRKVTSLSGRELPFDRALVKQIEKFPAEDGETVAQVAAAFNELKTKIVDAILQRARAMMLGRGTLPERVLVAENAPLLNLHLPALITDFYTVLRMLRPTLRSTKGCVCFYGGNAHSRNIVNVLRRIGAVLHPVGSTPSIEQIEDASRLLRGRQFPKSSLRPAVELQPILNVLGLGRTPAPGILVGPGDLQFMFEPHRDADVLKAISEYYQIVDEIKCSVIIDESSLKRVVSIAHSGSAGGGAGGGAGDEQAAKRARVSESGQSLMESAFDRLQSLYESLKSEPDGVVRIVGVLLRHFSVVIDLVSLESSTHPTFGSTYLQYITEMRNRVDALTTEVNKQVKSFKNPAKPAGAPGSM